MASSRLPLYYTLNQNLSSAPPSAAQMKTLGQALKTLSADNAAQVLRLIYEHGLVTGELPHDPTNVTLPYQLKQEGEDISLDLAQMPIDLLWILSKFVEIVTKKE